MASNHMLHSTTRIPCIYARSLKNITLRLCGVPTSCSDYLFSHSLRCLAWSNKTERAVSKLSLRTRRLFLRLPCSIKICAISTTQVRFCTLNIFSLCSTRFLLFSYSIQLSLCTNRHCTRELRSGSTGIKFSFGLFNLPSSLW